MQKYAIRAHEANALNSSMEVIRFELFRLILFLSDYCRTSFIIRQSSQFCALPHKL